MNILLKLSGIGLLALAMSCNASKEAAQTDAASPQAKTSIVKADTMKKMQEEGFSVGTIKQLKNSKCAYILVDEKSGAKFDPINLDTDKFKTFQKDQEKVYFKVHYLRMKNRCTEAQPVEITDIKKREN